MTKPKYSFFVDWETSGTTWTTIEETCKQYQGIACGWVVADNETFEPVETGSFLVKFDSSKYKWSKEAEAIHGISQEDLAEHGLSVQDAVASLCDPIIRHFYDPKQIVVMFGGHNVEFDIAFTKQLLEQFGVMPVVHHVQLNSAPLGFALVKTFKADQVFELLGDLEEARGNHDALDDALLSLACFRNARAIFTEVTGG